MAQDLISWLDSFGDKHVLLVGDLILDRYLYGDAERISPEARCRCCRLVEAFSTTSIMSQIRKFSRR